MKRLFRFLKALWKYIHKGHRVDFKIYSQRIDKCSDCFYFKSDKWTCGICGCYVTKKAKMNTEDCPMKKWKGEE